MRLVLLDVDGTLVNAGGAGRWALARAFESVFGIESVSDAAGGVKFDGRTDPRIIADIAALAGISSADLARQARRLEEIYLALLEGRLRSAGTARALPGVTDLLAAMEAARIPFGLLTGNIERGALLKIRAGGIETLFAAGAFGSDGADRIDLGRLARERFQSILRAPIAATEVVVIGDSVEDVRAARANGYRSLIVLTGWSGREALVAENPGTIFPDLSATDQVLRWILA